MKRLRIFAGGCAALLLINTGLLLQVSHKQKALEQQMVNMQNQTMDSISANTANLSQQIQNLLEEQTSILSSSDFSVEKQNGTIVVLAEATPKAIADGEAALFRLKKTDGTIQTQTATLENGIWKATMETGLFDEGILSIAITSGGTTKQEELGSVSASTYSIVDAQSQWGQNQSTLYLLVYPSDSFYEIKDIIKAEALVENVDTGESFTVTMSPVSDVDAILLDNSASDEAAPTPEISNIQRLGFSADLASYFQEGQDYLITFAITTSDGTVLSGGQDSTSYRKEKSGGTLSLSGGSISLAP